MKEKTLHILLFLIIYFSSSNLYSQKILSIGTDTAGFYIGAPKHFKGIKINIYDFYQTDYIAGINLSLISRVEEIKGLSLSIYNHNYNISGLSLGILNRRGNCTGLQLGILNYADSKGVQIGLLNKTPKEVQGLQIGLFNYIGFNKYKCYCPGVLQGLQLSIINITEINKGVQVGFINFSKRGKGIQLGLLNIRKDNFWFVKCLPIINFKLERKREYYFE